jgi:hypothetical protein
MSVSLSQWLAGALNEEKSIDKTETEITVLSTNFKYTPAMP